MAEAHRLDVFLDHVVSAASAAKLWGMMRWLRKAVALASNPLSKDHLTWPLTDSDANFKYVVLVQNYFLGPQFEVASEFFMHWANFAL